MITIDSSSSSRTYEPAPRPVRREAALPPLKTSYICARIIKDTGIAGMFLGGVQLSAALFFQIEHCIFSACPLEDEYERMAWARCFLTVGGACVGIGSAILHRTNR